MRKGKGRPRPQQHVRVDEGDVVGLDGVVQDVFSPVSPQVRPRRVDRQVEKSPEQREKQHRFRDEKQGESHLQTFLHGPGVVTPESGLPDNVTPPEPGDSGEVGEMKEKVFEKTVVIMDVPHKGDN